MSNATPPSLQEGSAGNPGIPGGEHHFTNNIVRQFLESNLSIVLILLSAVVGLAALFITPREEDPQIVVPVADVYVNFPGHSAQEVEQLVATPLEKLLYQIDGVEYVYAMSRADQAIITVRFLVGEDRERSQVKIFKKIDENRDVVPAGVMGWVVKPVEIDDVPVVTLTLAPKTLTPTLSHREREEDKTLTPALSHPRIGERGADEYALRRVAEELAQRLATVPDLSRTQVIGGQPRLVRIVMNPDRMEAHGVTPAALQQALAGANVARTTGKINRLDQNVLVEVGSALTQASELNELVVAVWDGRPVFLRDVADVIDGPGEATSYVRHLWGPARATSETIHVLGASHDSATSGNAMGSTPGVTIAVSKKKGSNAVWVAQAVIKEAEKLRAQIVPGDMELIVTRNAGHTADEKVNELMEALLVAVLIVIALLTISLGWREALIVAVAVPVVFGLTLAVNMLLGFSINRVTLFALILALGLLVDDPIVDVENISRHFAVRKKATRRIVLEAVAEIRPPLIAATLAVILSFLPMFFITGMMGPYMRPMALNVPVTMLMSMLVAFTITPWMSYHILKKHAGDGASAQTESAHAHDPHDIDAVRQTRLWKIFYPLMAPLLHHRWMSWTFLVVMGLLTIGAMGLAATRHVPLKMLPFDNKNELLLVLDTDRGVTLERTDALAREMEAYLAAVPEVVDVTSYVGVASPIDFNGLVRHYYLRQGPTVAEIRINLAPKKQREMQSHGIGLRLRPELEKIAAKHQAKLKIVETPPGPPVLSTLVAEVRGTPASTYPQLMAAAQVVKDRLAKEPGVVDVEAMIDAPMTQWTFVVDKEKAALHGITTHAVEETVRGALSGTNVGVLRDPTERQPLLIETRLAEAERSNLEDLARLTVAGSRGAGHLVRLSEIGRWEQREADVTIYHKNMQRVVFVLADTAGRAPAEAIVDIQADRRPASWQASAAAASSPRPLEGRTFFSSGSHLPWSVPEGIEVDFAGEGEWKITLDVFRDLGMAFGAAMVAIYILLVWQTGSFMIPVVVMLAIPLTVLGVMPGFWLLNAVGAGQVGPHPDPVFFTATGMIGMIALAGIVTRDSIILVDFIHLSLKRGRTLFDAIMESRVVRLRPILLTAAAAMLGAVPIIIDPIFSGLAWALIFGLMASTVFTLFVIPVTYWLLYANKPGHGLPMENMEE